MKTPCKETRPNDCQFIGKLCGRCGLTIRYIKSGRCVACMHRERLKKNIKRKQKKEGTTISQAQRRAIEDHQHKHDEDWYRL